MKFQNKRTKSGHRSLYERDIHKNLKKGARKNKAKVAYEQDALEYTITRLYNPDFTILCRNGHVIFVEAKGYFRPEDKTKMKFVKICNPEADIRMLFLKKNRKDIAWCERNGFPWAVGVDVPEEWYHGS